METSILSKKLRIGGMTCVSCQSKIERKLRRTAGIQKADVSYNTGTASITYDTSVISLRDIAAIIRKLDYTVLTGNKPEKNRNRIIGILIIVVAVYVVLQQLGFTQIFNAFPLANAGTGFGMLFVIGLVTSVHCVAMCGGINLSQCIPQAAADRNNKTSALRPSLMYNLGRVLSYTAVGAVVGALGSVVSLSGGFRGIVQLAAGIFMVIMGLNMLGIFPWLRRLNPHMPKIFAHKIESQKAGSKSPLYVGMLNGLMPCGPLQAMQLFALSTASPIAGALSMLLFSLGTVPLMFGLGALSSILTKKFTHKIMTVGAMLVVVLGFTMFTQGWSLSGFPLPSLIPPFTASAQSAAAQSSIQNGVQIVNSTLARGRYPAIVVQAGIPVKWTINAPQDSLNGCTNKVLIPEYKIEYQFETGENILNFTPGKTGTFQYTCWMGMIRGSIKVVEAGTEAPGNTAPLESDVIPSPDPVDPALDPVPANITLPTDNIVVAKLDDTIQKIQIELTDNGFSPAVFVVQAGTDTDWVINNTSSRKGNETLLIPAYYAKIPMKAGKNPVTLYPTASFDFSTKDNAFYGYVVVVDDLSKIDLEAVKEEVKNYQPLIYPSSYFSGGGSASTP